MRMLPRLVFALLLNLTLAKATLVVYSNTTSYSGFAFSPGGAELQGSNTITRLMADDITPDAGSDGLPVTQISAVVRNGSSGSVTFRALGRFWTDSGGYPETLLYAGAFGTYTLDASQTLTITLSPAGFLLLLQRPVYRLGCGLQCATHSTFGQSRANGYAGAVRSARLVQRCQTHGFP